MKPSSIRSTIWQVFEKQPDKVVCTLCQANFKRSKYGTTSNLRRHIRANHKEYAEGLNLSIDTYGISKDDSKRSRRDVEFPTLSLSMTDQMLLLKEEIDESTLNNFFNESNANLSTTESLLFATSRPLDDLEPPTASDTPTSSVQQPIEQLEEELREKEMKNLHAEWRKMIEELMASREENRRLREELNKVNRLYLKKSIELDLAKEEISRLKGESIDDEDVTYLN